MSGRLAIMRNKSDTHRIVLVATSGVPLFELATAVEVFGINRSDLTPDWYAFELVATSEPAVIGGGLRVPAGRGLDAFEQADTIVVPACASIHDSAPTALATALRAADERGTRLVSLCSGAFVFAQAGVLHGRRATTHWMHAAELARKYPSVYVDADVLYARDGNVWTSAGSAAALDLCLEIVRHDHGQAVANEVARRIVTPPHREGGQAQYVRHIRNPVTEPVDVTDWAREHIADATVAAMARHANISQRTLVRRFHHAIGTTPQAWLLRERLSIARELLETTNLTTEAIAGHIGLGSATNLRTRFAAAFGISPNQYRRTFTTVSRPRRPGGHAGCR
jgi:AraC family transcriptional regulator, transcriptional activator FtrA